MQTTYKFRIFTKINDYQFNLQRISFGKKLAAARKRKGLSQSDVAKVRGTKGPAIGRYERDEMR